MTCGSIIFSSRLLREPADRPAAEGDRGVLLPGHPVQPHGLPAGRVRTQTPGTQDHTQIRLRTHPDRYDTLPHPPTWGLIDRNHNALIVHGVNGLHFVEGF